MGVASLVGRSLLIRGLLLVLVIGAAKTYVEPSPYWGPQAADTPDVVWYLARGYDAPAYQGLAEHGYYDRYSRNYPLGYPLLIRAVRPLVGSVQTAAVLVSNLTALAAVAVFVLLARYYARRMDVGGRAPEVAVTLFACTPGILAFGTVAYSEAPYLLVALTAWWAYLRAEQPDAGTRALGWLALAGLAAGASVMIKHLGGPVLVGLALIEGLRVMRAERRGRALLEAAAVLWAVVPVAAYFVWKYTAHDMAGLQDDIWQMRFVPLWGPASLVAMGTAPEYVAQIYVTLPLVIWLVYKLRVVDGRLALIAGLLLLEALSFTGIAAQSSTRYMWSIWPLALGGLTLTDRSVGWALCGVLFIVSAWCAIGHVLGTAAF
jgi:4-amino-4-deoxy-L-arabinose transferase-like glycosyltransferase